MDKVLKSFLNTLKCPLCGSLIDIFDGKEVKRKFNFACSSNYTHYGIWLNSDLYPFIEEEVLEIHEKNHMYLIHQFHSQIPNTHMCSINIFNINGDGNITGSLSSNFVYDKSLFDFRNTNRSKLLNKIKTILVFQ